MNAMTKIGLSVISSTVSKHNCKIVSIDKNGTINIDGSDKNQTACFNELGE